MSKRKTTPTLAARKVQAAKIVPSATNTKHAVYMAELLTYLGYRGRHPDSRLAAVALARTLKSEWSNGESRKLEAVLASGIYVTNYLGLLKNSPLGPTAKALVEELGREVHPKIANHPEWPVFIGELNSAMS